MPSKNESFTLEENLALTNQELTSNISKLASLIRAYEGIPWKEAQEKSGRLLRELKAVAYINTVRQAVKEGKPIPAESELPSPIKLKVKDSQTVYERNYERLMKIAPGLEQKLLDYKPNDQISGRSESRGYMDFTLELLFKEKNRFHIAIAHYYLQNGDMVPDPDMEILVDPIAKTVEALHFQDIYHYVEVYDDKVDRAKVDLKEKASQNTFLSQWLKNLKRQDHKIEWKEEETTGVPHSEILDNYHKEEREKSTQVEEKKNATTETIETEPKKSTEKQGKKQEAKIISLPETLNAEKISKRFLNIVDYLEFDLEGGPNDLVKKAQQILDETGSAQYLMTQWERLLWWLHDKVRKLSYYRFLEVFPDLIERLRAAGTRLRLVSDEVGTVFAAELGDDRKKNVVTIGFYNYSQKDQENSLLVTLDELDKSLRVDLLIGRFSHLSDFRGETQDPLNEFRAYKTAVDVEHWLKYMLAEKFHIYGSNTDSSAQELPIKTESDDTAKEPEVAPSTESGEKAETPEDEHYINKDIPDFEPGHVKLVEAHIKRGVTQQMIDRINETGEGITIFPRRQVMVYNTKSKEADKAHHAERPGFRLSRTGKFYTEGRSNRADRTTDGL